MKTRSILILMATVLLAVGLPVVTVVAGGPPNRTHVHVEGGDHFVCSSGAEVDGSFWSNDNYITELEGTILTITGSTTGHGELTSSTGQTYQDQVSAHYEYVVDISTVPETLLEYSESGNSRHLFVPGEGTIYHDAGTLAIVIDPLTGEVTVEETGHHDLFFSGLDVCGYFGEGTAVGGWVTFRDEKVLGPRH